MPYNAACKPVCKLLSVLQGNQISCKFLNEKIKIFDKIQLDLEIVIRLLRGKHQLSNKLLCSSVHKTTTHSLKLIVFFSEKRRVYEFIFRSSF